MSKHTEGPWFVAPKENGPVSLNTLAETTRGPEIRSLNYTGPADDQLPEAVP